METSHEAGGDGTAANLPRGVALLRVDAVAFGALTGGGGGVAFPWCSFRSKRRLAPSSFIPSR